MAAVARGQLRGAGGMKTWERRSGTGNRLTDAYLRGEPGACALYAYAPGDGEAERRAADLDGLYDGRRRAGLVSALAAYADAVAGLSPAVESSLQKLSDPRCLAVVTGQQAGLFTGPLYTVYKAVSAVVHARRLEERLKRPVVPIFWVASEDHDFDEAASAWYVSSGGGLRRAALRERPPVRTPVGLHAIGADEMGRLLDELSAELPDGLFRQDLLADIAEAHERTANMGDFFVRLLAGFLREAPPLFLNPLRRDLRALARPAFERVLRAPEVFRDAAARGAERVQAAGYTPQVEVHARHTLLYLLEGGRRSALDFDPERPGEFALRDSGRRFSGGELAERLERRPEDFSAGVLYRPVVQDELLPVLAYVGGAAEIAYHAVAGEVFAAAGRRTPPLFLRGRGLALPRSVARALARYDFAPEDALAGGLVDRYLRSTFAGPPVGDVIAGLQAEAERSLGEREAYFCALDPSLRTALARTHTAVRDSLRRLGSRAEKALRLRHAEAARALGEAETWLRPHGEEQERVLSPLSLIAKYGRGWMRELAEGDHPAWDEIWRLEW